MNSLLVIVMYLIAALAIQPSSALENHGRILKWDNETGGCVPNDAKDGIVCTNITLYKTTILNDTLWVQLDLNTSFSEDTDLFTTHVWIWVTFRQFVDKLWAEFEFNSTTPNNTWLATGWTTIGIFDVPTGDKDIPIVPVEVTATHNVTLFVGDCLDYPANDSFCDVGTLWAIIGLQANGSVQSETAGELTVTVNEPWAVRASGDYRFAVNPDTFCYDLVEKIWYNPELTAEFEKCSPQGLCQNQTFTWNTTTWDETHVFANDTCFDRSVL